MLLVAAMLLSETAKATNPEIAECIEKCEKALKKADAHIYNIEAINNLQTALLQKQNIKISQLEADATAWHRNPVLLIAIGFSLGIAYNMSNGSK